MSNIEPGHYKRKKQIFDRHECPACHHMTFIISVFGSICGRCFFDPAKDELPKEPTDESN